MRRTEHKPGIHEQFLKTRRLKLGDLPAEQRATLVADLDQLCGVNDVSFDAEKHVLTVEYDVTKACLDVVEEVVDKHHGTLTTGWWSRFKEGWYRFTDNNIRANSTHEPLSCHKV